MKDCKDSNGLISAFLNEPEKNQETKEGHYLPFTNVRSDNGAKYPMARGTSATYRYLPSEVE